MTTTTRSRRRARIVVSTALAFDAVIHLYWATGTTWPATNRKALASAVLGGALPFRTPSLLGLAALLLALSAATLVSARSALMRVVVLFVAAALSIRTVVGVSWIFGANGVDRGTPFYWLNVAVYTPACLLLTAAAYQTSSDRWRRVTGATIGSFAVVSAIGVFAAAVPAVAEANADRAPLQDSSYAHYIDTPVARFHYLEDGSGSPVVLISPGAAWTFAWHDEFHALSNTHTVYVVDLPGQGFTELHDKSFRFDLAAMTGALVSFMDATALPHAIVAGNSWSGGWALAFAQRYPTRVDKRILLAPSGLDRPDPLSWELLKVPMLGELATRWALGTRAVVAGSARDLLVHREQATADVIDAMWRVGTRPDNVRSFYLLERRLDWRSTEAALATTAQPTLILWGAQDKVLPATQAATFARRLPHATVRVLDGCGHALTLDCPQPVIATMRSFLDGS